ncbi:MAG TPA: hypothetical protein VF089_03860, partial [Candidatus Binatia bacterium]
MTPIALVLSAMSVPPVTRIIEARVSRLCATMSAMAIKSTIVTSPVLSSEFSVVTVAPAMFVSTIVFGV